MAARVQIEEDKEDSITKEGGSLVSFSESLSPNKQIFTLKNIEEN